MKKSTRNDSNNGEEILSVKYKKSNYQLLTLTQSYISKIFLIFSAMVDNDWDGAKKI